MDLVGIERMTTEKEETQADVDNLRRQREEKNNELKRTLEKLDGISRESYVFCLSLLLHLLCLP